MENNILSDNKQSQVKKNEDLEKNVYSMKVTDQAPILLGIPTEEARSPKEF
jgi:hypothetical protein